MFTLSQLFAIHNRSKHTRRFNNAFEDTIILSYPPFLDKYPDFLRVSKSIKGKDNKLFSVLDHKLLNVIDKPERLIIKAVSFFIDHIVDPWSLEDLKEAVVETNVILELHITDSLSDNKNPIIYIPEKILEEKEIRRQKMIADFNDKELLRLVEKAGDVEHRNSICKKTT